MEGDRRVLKELLVVCFDNGPTTEGMISEWVKIYTRVFGAAFSSRRYLHSYDGMRCTIMPFGTLANVNTSFRVDQDDLWQPQ